MRDNTLKQVVDCIAATTRYPTELLTADAELENGLGIDSVKRVEIIVALGEKFGLDLMAQAGAPSARTIADIAELVDGLLNKDSESEQPVRDIREEKVRDIREEKVPHVRTGVISDAVQASMPQPIPAPHYLGNVREEESATAARPLNGRVALVTGSGRGVGRTIARLLARRGATVIVNSFHSREQGEQTAAEINADGGRAVHIWGSVANPEHVDKMFEQIDRHEITWSTLQARTILHHDLDAAADNVLDVRALTAFRIHYRTHVL